MIEQILLVVSHPFPTTFFGLLAVVAIVALLLRFFQSRRRKQNIELKQYISHHVEDEMVGIRRDISVVIQNELLKLKRRIPILIKDEIAKLKGNISVGSEKKVIDFSKSRSIRVGRDENASKTDKNDTANIEKRIEKLDRNMSVLMALLVEMKHRAATGKEAFTQDKSKEELNRKR